MKEGQIVNRLAEEYSKDHRKELTDESVLEKVAEAAKNKVHITRSKSGIVVKGIDDMAVRFSRCCNPVPGDEIVGFITRGRGMSIHAGHALLAGADALAAQARPDGAVPPAPRASRKMRTTRSRMSASRSRGAATRGLQYS